MDQFQQGLRCQDVHSGLRNVDPNSPLLQPLADTRVVGMAATLAGLIRGRDVVTDAQSLAMVAAAQLDVDMLAFNDVVEVLEEVGFVQGVQRQGRKILSFTETVPYYDDLYGSLGISWSERQPTELEQQLILVVDGLSAAPRPVEDLEHSLGLDRSDLPNLMDLGNKTGLVQLIRTIDGDLAYSPFFGFENPQLFGDLVLEHGTDRLAAEFAALREQQGLPINQQQFPLLTDAVARGLIMAPSVQLPQGSSQPFAALPYVPDQRLLVARKPVLDKALAVLACLRCAQHFGGYSSLTPAGLVNAIDKLLDRNRGFLNPHEDHKRQYDLMHKAGLITFGPDPMPGGKWVVPTFIDSEDNREALNLARDLITHGEALQRRIDDAQARSALDLGKGYVAPLQTMNRTRKLAMTDSKHFNKVFEAAMGRAEL
ncbi:hypothetical protein [Kibdelosporangium aridum]|uniref:Uncharacterized protein n=1 Tax=Kibdelosporangium aridum TaxID=2030 RepID=A0A1W2EYI8_KIBAR|nr:hypothetical protein [Kibdelosporangium aridum]SMD14720.1 hypothetical protein SAMN05661093_05104 [Kibdelosporangium aridum]